MKLKILFSAILAVASANSMAAANGKDPATKPALPVTAAAAASQSSSGPYYVEFGEFVYRLVVLQKSDHSEPVDVNDLPIELVYDDASYWFDLVL